MGKGKIVLARESAEGHEKLFERKFRVHSRDSRAKFLVNARSTEAALTRSATYLRRFCRFPRQGCRGSFFVDIQ